MSAAKSQTLLQRVKRPFVIKKTLNQPEGNWFHFSCCSLSLSLSALLFSLTCAGDSMFPQSLRHLRGVMHSGRCVDSLWHWEWTFGHFYRRHTQRRIDWLLVDHLIYVRPNARSNTIQTKYRGKGVEEVIRGMSMCHTFGQIKRRFMASSFVSFFLLLLFFFFSNFQIPLNSNLVFLVFLI